jgi:putative ABC transport system permease protein
VVSWLHHVGIELPAPGASTASVIRPFVPFLYLVRTLAMATFGAALATLWPAFRASRPRPVEALQSV